MVCSIFICVIAEFIEYNQRIQASFESVERKEKHVAPHSKETKGEMMKKKKKKKKPFFFIIQRFCFLVKYDRYANVGAFVNRMKSL